MLVKYLRIKAYSNGFVCDNFSGEGPILTTGTEVLQYIGQWVNPYSVKPDMGECMFRLELCKEGVDYQQNHAEMKGEMLAKLTFSNFMKQPYDEDDIVIIKLNDPDGVRLEIVGSDADTASTKINMPPMKKDGIKYLSFPYSKGSLALLERCKGHLIETTSEQIIQWYAQALLEQKEYVPPKENKADAKKPKPKN